jgi:hypothetical protein
MMDAGRAPRGTKGNRREAVPHGGSISSTCLLAAVMLGVGLGSLRRVMVCVLLVAVRRVRVMGGLLVVPFFVMLRSRAVMPGGVLVVLGGLGVVINGVL